MKTKIEIKEMIDLSETQAAKLSYELNSLDQRGYIEYGSNYQN